jgi:para-nitrobenzyl esterase
MKFTSLMMSAAAVAVLVSPSPISAMPSQNSLVVAQAAHEPYTEDTAVGTLLDDPQAKAVLQKYLPDLITSDRIDKARGMSLRQMRQFAPDKLSDDTLKTIDAELAKLNAPKS